MQRVLGENYYHNRQFNIREIDCTSLPKGRNLPLMWSLGCLVIRTPRACPWEQSVVPFENRDVPDMS